MVRLPTLEDMHPDALIAGRYRLQALVGAGAMGQVWRGRDERLQREVAVKVVDLAAATGPVSADRVQREALATARLNHPNIVTTFDGGVDGDVAYLVMELLDGTPLSTRLRGGPLPVREAARIAADIARALEATHLIGVVHADIKPGNVMLTRTGQVKVLDFGIARLTADTTEAAHPADALGTAAYMSPEQAQGRPVGPASDLYSLGCLLFAMLAGRPPFPGTDSLAVARAQVHAAPPRLRDARPDVPPPLDALVAAMLAKDPAARPTALAAAQALGQASGRPPTPVPPTRTAVLPTQTAVLPAQTAVLPAQTAVLPAQTAVLPAATASLPAQEPVPARPTPVGSARVSDVGADLPGGGHHHRPAWFGRGVKWVLLAMVGLLIVAAVWFGGTRLAALLPQPGADPAPAAPTTSARPKAPASKPATQQPPAIQWPTVQLPTVQLPTVQLPSIPSAGEAALRGVTEAVTTTLDSWTPQGKDATQAKAALQREWAKASDRIVKGQDAQAQLDAFAASVDRLHAKDAIPAGTYAALQVAISAVDALL